MATVFLARDVRHRRQVAVKVLRPDIASAVGADRFLFEVETASRLTHPHILPLLDSGDADGLLYYVMPYVDGESLRHRLRRERQLAVADAVRIAGEVASALDYAHRCDVVHRDIKPENILLEDGQAVVADFGIARAISRAGEDPAAPAMHAGRTATGVALGTPAYMSPEQAAGDHALDGRSDIYSLGCVLYEMLVGEPPFTGPTAESVVRQHLTVTAPAVTTVRPAVPTGVAEAVSRALEKTPADRFASATEFGEALRTLVNGRVNIAPERSDPVRQISGPKTRMALGLVALVVLVASAAGAWGKSEWFGARVVTKELPAPPRAYTIVTAVQGTAAEADRAVARTLIVSALDQSSIVASLPDEQLRLGLASAGRPSVLPVDATTARELAIRGGMKTVIVPSVDRIGDTYNVSIRALQADSGDAFVTETAIAKGENELIPTIDRAVLALRRRIGEQSEAVAASRPLWWVTTPSLDAYRLYEQGLQFQSRREPHAAAPLFLEALAIDPDFASAWSGLGVVLFNSGLRDSAARAWRESLARPGRLTELQRLNVVGMSSYARGDVETSADAYKRLHERYGPVHANNHAVLLSTLDRTAEGIELVHQQERASPFGLTPLVRGNLALWLSAVGRFPEARQRAAGLGAEMQARVAAQEGAWAEAESLALFTLDTLARVEQRGANLYGILASTAAAQGRIGEAFNHLRTRRKVFVNRGDVQRIRKITYDVIHLSMASGSPLDREDARILAMDSSARARAVEGLFRAISGDTALAAEVIRMREPSRSSDPASLLRGADHALLVAGIAIIRRDVPAVTKALAPIAPRAKVELNPGSHVAYWMLAEAYERGGLLDSAAVWFTALTDITRFSSEDREFGFGLAHSFAQFRLARIHAARGDHASARKHANAFLDAFREPDPRFTWMVTSAQRLAGQN